MRREQELRRRLHALSLLGEAVGAMKSLSAHHFRQARKAVEPARAYREGIEHVAGSAGFTLPPGTGPAGLLVIGPELGLCGSYNSRVVDAGLARRSALGSGPTFCVGHRAASLLLRRGLACQKIYGAPTSVRGITGTLLRLGEDLLGAYATAGLSSFDIVSSRFLGVGVVRPGTVRLLPGTPQPDGLRPPARYVSSAALASAAVRELLYITLYDLLLDALATEHGARLLATQAAESWLDEQRDALRRQLAAGRREASTQEVIEITAGSRRR